MFASTNARVAIVAVALVIFAVGGAVLVFGNQGPPPQHRLLQVSVSGTTMTPSDLQANEGDTITVSISTDQYEEIHLHGYDKHFFPSPSQPSTVTFVADKTGKFVIEIESTSTSLGLLEVQPRSGFLGLNRPPDQSSTTVHAAGGGTLIKIGSTNTFNLVAEIGPLQPMYTPSQVGTQHPKSGEVMFSGEMVMPPGNQSSPSWKHIEVHIFDKKTGDVVKTLSPMITVTDNATGKSQQIPNVAMQGVVEGAGDFHYGNNVDLPAGAYKVTVTVGSETTAFDFNVQ
jgi:hypothetical protein